MLGLPEALPLPARREFVTGFHKRKLQRRKEAQECAAAPAPLSVVSSAWVIKN